MKIRTIVLLEDDGDSRALYCLWLEKAGFKVIAEHNCKNINQLIAEHEPVLVITDMVMPEFEGIQCIFSILNSCCIPVIAISAYPQYLALVDLIVAKCLPKPLSETQLIEAVDCLLISQ